MILYRSALIAIFGMVLLGTPNAQAISSSDLEGQVTDEQGAPLVGALVSVFGSELGGAGLIAVTDDEGRFRLPKLPPGLYSLRAYLSGFLPSRFSRIEVGRHEETIPIAMELPSLDDVGESGEQRDAGEVRNEENGEDASRMSELKWLLRHGKRNVLHRETPTVVEVASPEEASRSTLAPDVTLSGELGVVASAFDQGLSDFPGAGAGLDARLAYARLDIPTGTRSHWLVDAQLMESVLSSWAGSAEFVTGDGEGQELHAGVSYGNHFYGALHGLRPPEAGLHHRRSGERSTEWFGNAFGSHRLTLGSTTLETEVDYHHYSYLDQAGYVAPHVAVSWQPDGGPFIRGLVDYQILAPGGEDLDILARMVSADFVAPVENTPRGLRAERTVRYQLSIEQPLDEASALMLRVFQEEATDQLVKAYLKDQPHLRVGPGHYLVSNLGNFLTRGLGLGVSRQFGDVAGSVDYTFGVARGTTPNAGGLALMEDNEIHDLTTRVETHIDATKTRFLAVYRLIRHPAMIPSTDASAGVSQIATRFNVQVYQVLPFVGTQSTDWELMIALRNLFYEDVQGTSLLDEVAVIDSPRRLLGGVSVRF